MKRIRLMAVLNALSFLIHVCFSFLTQFKLVNAKDVWQVSSEYSSLFTPAPITFAIWGVIYLALALFCIYHLIMAWKHGLSHRANQDVKRIGGWFILNNLAAAALLLSWTHRSLLWSMVFILIQLDALISINLRLGIYDRRPNSSSKLFTQAPFSIYFGWIMIASISNISVYLSANGWSGFGMDPESWTMIMITIVVVITMLVVLIRKNIFFGLAVIWALYGIILKRNSVGAALYFEVIRTAWLGIGIIAFVCVLQVIRNSMLEKPHDPFPEAPRSLK